MIQSSQIPKTFEKELFIIHWALCQGKNGAPKGSGRADLISPLFSPAHSDYFV
jgi:hypothetical protein